MRKVCLINSFNYDRWLPSCIESALNQTVQFDQIIIVDDGSSDNSVELIKYYANQSKGKIIFISKNNGGQLSSINAAVGFIQDGDQVFILDSDDYYPGDYLELILRNMGPKLWDISFVAQIPVSGDEMITSAFYCDASNFTCDRTSAIVRARKMWIGNPSSTISISGALFNKIFPYPNECDFITRADDVIVYASSIFGAKKTFIRSIGTCWRVHQTNNSLKIATEDADERDVKLMRLFEYYSNKYSLAFPPSRSEYLSECDALSPISKEFLNSLLGQHDPIL